MRRILVAGATWAVALMAAVLGAGAAGAQEQVFRVNNTAEPESLDPGLVTGVPEHRIISNLFEGLTTTDPKDLSPRPGMARSWTVSKDGLVYTFQLREATWTDRRKVTAHDFVYAWERVLNPKTGAKYAQQLYYLRNGEEYNKGQVTDFSQVGVKALDDKTLQATLRCPTAYFLDLTSFYTLYPVPKWAIEAHGKDWVKPGKIVSNGPFRLASWVPQRELVLEKNASHWDAATVKLQKAVFIPTDDINTAYKQFLAGDSDWIPTVPPAQIDAAKQRPEYYVTPYLGTYYFRFNVTKPPLSDGRVRKALSMAVDRESLVKFVTKAGEIPTSGFVPAGMRGYEGVRGLPYDPAAAKRLLAEAGFPDGKGFPKTELLYNTNELHRVITQAVQQMWRETLGIQVELANVEWKVYLARQSKLDYQISRAGWIGDYVDPNTFLDMWITGGGNNQTGWSNKRYDELVAKAGCGIVDPKERMKALQEAEKILVVDEVPIVPLYTYVNKGMLSRKVKGWQPNILDQHPLKYLSIEK
ncbi:MAG TPA: peptide ABC transporter substrate-binding protein [Methylomirabilota bacterium]|jgi:oligopeptide transport system substrate-binding protein|nr:peptide ABC transporter substrate-binding protein [Methylomirabilota bacterium]